MGNIGEVRNESSVEVGKAHKGMNVLELLRRGPRVNTIKFDWVHGEFIRLDNHTKVANLHFSSLRCKFSSSINWRTHLVHSVWVALSGEKIRRSSI